MMAFDHDTALARRRRIAGSDGSSATQPFRAEVGRPWGMELGHVKEMTTDELAARYVPVRRIRRTRPDPPDDPWDGNFEYVTDEPEQFLCLPPLRARHYQALVYKGDDANAVVPVVRLFWWKGAWVADHPQVQMLSSDQLTELLQRFTVTDCTPVPLLESS